MANLEPKVHPLILGAVTTLCVASVALILLLPLESLVVDLLYQAF